MTALPGEARRTAGPTARVVRACYAGALLAAALWLAATAALWRPCLLDLHGDACWATTGSPLMVDLGGWAVVGNLALAVVGLVALALSATAPVRPSVRMLAGTSAVFPLAAAAEGWFSGAGGLFALMAGLALLIVALPASIRACRPRPAGQAPLGIVVAGMPALLLLDLWLTSGLAEAVGWPYLDVPPGHGILTGVVLATAAATGWYAVRPHRLVD